MNLMIVDDHVGVRKIIRTLIESDGDVVLECGCADYAVRLAPDFRPDFVTMDVHMPGMCALQAIRAIHQAHPRAFVVLVSSYDASELKDLAMDAGAAGYLTKVDLIELPHYLQRAAAQVSASPTVAPALSPLDDEIVISPSAFVRQIQPWIEEIRICAALLDTHAPAEAQDYVRRIHDACLELNKSIQQQANKDGSRSL